MEVHGDPKIEMELSSALREKTSNFTPRDLPCIGYILDAHHLNKTSGPPGSGMEMITNIQSDAFELVMRQLDYDVKAFRVWTGKMRNYDSVPQPRQT